MEQALALEANEKELLRHILAQLEEERGLDCAAAMADMRFLFIRRLCERTVVKPQESKEHARSQKIDRILTGKYTAIPIFILISLYLFLACLDYLEVESLFVVPFSLKEGRSERARATLHILTDAGSTVGKPIDAEDIHPFAAAMLEGLAAKFMPMDGRFLADKTAYGSASAEKPTGESTVAEYLGYFQDRGDSIFSRHLKVFGMAGDLI